ncbi:unnamed protein product [Rotaria sp. Silwood1]|nr:unnamed protein product [Rotaria sp. Silwood1]
MKQETDFDIDEMKYRDHTHESFTSDAELRLKQETDLDIDEMKRHDHIHESFASNAELRKRYIRTKRVLGHRIFANRSLQLDRIKSSGFDMDYTLALYKSPEFEEVTFQQIIESLIELGYSEQI